MKNYYSNKNMRVARLLLSTIFTILFAFTLSYVILGVGISASVATGVLVVGTAILSLGYKKSERRGMAFMACGEIDADLLLAECEDLEEGVEATLLIANKSDIESITYDVTNPMLATAITMKTGKKFYTIDGIKSSTRPSWEMIKRTIRNKWKHQVKFAGFSIDPDFMKTINSFAQGSYVVLIANNQVGATGNQKWDVYGAGTGLKGEAITRDPYNADLSGGIDISIASQDDSLESSPPKRFFITSAAATQSAIDALLIAAP